MAKSVREGLVEDVEKYKEQLKELQIEAFTLDIKITAAKRHLEDAEKHLDVLDFHAREDKKSTVEQWWYMSKHLGL